MSIDSAKALIAKFRSDPAFKARFSELVVHNTDGSWFINSEGFDCTEAEIMLVELKLQLDALDAEVGRLDLKVGGMQYVLSQIGKK